MNDFYMLPNIYKKNWNTLKFIINIDNINYRIDNVF